MKKILFALLLLIPVIAVAKSPKNKRVVIVSPVYSDPAIYENDSIIFEFYTYSDYMITLEIKNKKNERIYIEWENSRIDDERICFNNDTERSFRLKREDEVIHSESLSKNEFGSYGNMSYWRKFFDTKNLKKTGESNTRVIIIPVKTSYKTTDYKFQIKMVADIQ